MELIKDATGYYYDQSAGTYYQPYTAPPAPTQPQGSGYAGMGGFQPSYGNTLLEIANRQYAPAPPKGMITYDNQSYIPFTGSATGINNGRKSMAYLGTQNRTPYQYQNINNMFSNMGNMGGMGSMSGGMGQFANMGGAPSGEGSSGAGRFVGGLL
jgi:hypothetical protein